MSTFKILTTKEVVEDNFNLGIQPTTETKPNYIGTSLSITGKDLQSLFVIKDISVLYFVQLDRLKEVIPESQIKIPIVPQKVAYQYSPNFSEQAILGRKTPLYLYIGGSDRTYSFSVMIHEDMEDLYPSLNIDDFVDLIKTMSYPVQEASLGQYLPNVYFQLGELAGFGIVNTSINWQKPFRNGRYIVAEISFSITITEILPVITPEQILRTTEGDFGVNEGIIYSGITTEDYNLRKYYMSTIGSYDSNISNFLSVGETEVFKDVVFEASLSYYNYGRQKLANIYDAFGINDTTPKLENSLGLLNSENTKGLLDLDISNKSLVKTNAQTTLNNLKKVKKNIESYVEHYYKEINKDLTQSKKKLIIEELLDIINNLEKSVEVILNYGSST